MNPHPGQTVKLKVNRELPNYNAQIVRLYNADPNPAGPGIQAIPVTPVMNYAGRHEPLPLGSDVRVPNRSSLGLTHSFRATAWIAPTTVPGGTGNPIAQYWTPTFTDQPQGIVSNGLGSPATACSWTGTAVWDLATVQSASTCTPGLRYARGCPPFLATRG
jgi:hypothetical protein